MSRIKKLDWVSSSFVDSFGLNKDSDDDDAHSPAGKRVKFEDSSRCIGVNNVCDDGSLVDNHVDMKSNFKSGNNRVWTDKYAPRKLDDLIVHKKKVSEVCDYLKSVFGCHKSNKILLITGPTGCGKTCTLNVLCRVLNISVVEWVTPIENSVNANYELDFPIESDKYIGRNKRATIQLFNEFILQAAKYSSLLSTDFDSVDRKIVLIKDFPNVFLEHPETFQETLRKYSGIDCDRLLNRNVSPLVFIISDTNIVRDLFPDDFKSESSVTTVSFNPVTQINIVKALDKILSLEFKRVSSKSKKPNNEELVDIAETSDGDLRSAILKLQFSLSNHSVKSECFKIPKPIPNPKCERIRVIKSTSKLKTAKHKICEIDKDKTVDFFNSVGRVLYPKKEFLDSSGNQSQSDYTNYRFVHSPSTIADVYTTEPNKFVNILHENYLDRFTDIKDVCNAANSLSISDVLLSSNWESKDLMVKYSLNTAARSLMVSNSKPAPNTFRPISKSRIWVTDNKRKTNQDLVRQMFPDIQCEKDALLDVIPYLTKLKINFQLTEEQTCIISKIAKYNK